MQASDLRNKSLDELNEELVALRREQFNLRMQQGINRSAGGKFGGDCTRSIC